MAPDHLFVLRQLSESLLQRADSLHPVLGILYLIGGFEPIRPIEHNEDPSVPITLPTVEFNALEAWLLFALPLGIRDSSETQ